LRDRALFAMLLLALSRCTLACASRSTGSPGAGGAGRGAGGSSGAAGSAGAGGNDVFQPVTISASPATMFESETAVATGPNGRVAAAWMGFESSFADRFIYYAFSSNDGGTWSTPSKIPLPTGYMAADPSLVADAEGDFYLSSLGFTFDGQTLDNSGVYVAIAPAGSDTFGDPVDVMGGVDPVAFYDKDWITITPGGTLLVTFNAQASAGNGVIAVTSADGGASWTRHEVYNDASGSTNPALPSCCAANGHVYVVWETFDLTTNAIREISLAHSENEGTSFGLTTVATADAESITIDDATCAARNDDVWVAYPLGPVTVAQDDQPPLSAVRVAHSADAGATLATRADADDPNGPPLMMHPQLAIDAGGTLGMTYYGGATSPDPAGMFVRLESSDGTHFTPAVIVEPTLEFAGVAGYENWLGDYTGIAAPNGQLYMTYANNADGSSHVEFHRAAL
jgi:hypothetical protein